MAIVSILLGISLTINVMWFLFMYDYAKDWPNEKQDFDEHMTKIHNYLNNA